jgi:hypothetical protein
MMKRASVFVGLGVAVCLATAASASTLNLQVTTDKPVYAPGETVTWTVAAWASAGDNRGVAMLGVDLAESQLEALSSALLDPVAGDPTSKQLHLGLYNHASGFLLASDLTGGTPGGTYDPDVPGVLSEVGVLQMPYDPVFNVGNDGSAHVFATGEYVPAALGSHTLSLAVTDALYWRLATDTTARFESANATPVTFLVAPEPATLALVAAGLLTLARRRRD